MRAFLFLVLVATLLSLPLALAAGPAPVRFVAAGVLALSLASLVGTVLRVMVRPVP